MGKIYIQRIDDKKGRILVFMEKHGNRYFLAETKEQVYDACLKILKERAWMFVEPEEPDLISLPTEPIDFGDDVVNELKAALIDIVQKSKRVNEQKLRDYKERLHEYKLVQAALKEESGDLAWAVISERHDCEYEDYEFEYLENV